MSYDPQNAPDTWLHEVRRAIDIDGVRIVIAVDQDGIEYAIDEDMWEDRSR